MNQHTVSLEFLPFSALLFLVRLPVKPAVIKSST